MLNYARTMKNEAEVLADESGSATEPRFIELNKVLEEKVSGLMSEVDFLLQKQMHLMHMPARHRRKAEQPASAEWASAAVGESGPPQPADRPAAESSADLGWTPSQPAAEQGRKSSSEAVLAFFRGQITKLQSDLHSMQREKNKMEDQCKDLETQLCKQEQTKDKLLNQQNSYKDHILKMESANSHASAKMQAQTAQISSLQKEIDILRKKLTSLSQISACNDLKLNRNAEENAKLRSSLKISQSEEKESREYIRKIQEEKRLALKHSEKQRTDIFQAFKKQMQLVNNLKKQKVYLETSKQVQFIEREFTKILDANKS